MILLVAELVLVEIQFFRVVRPVIPISEHELVAEDRWYNDWEIQLDVLVSLVEILPDWANVLYCPQKEIFPDLTD